jgi:proline utilization trans-activator
MTKQIVGNKSLFTIASILICKTALCGPMHVYWYHIFLHRYSYVRKKQLQQAYTRPPNVSNREAYLSYCNFLATLAFGQLHSVNQWSGFDGPPGFEYFTQALQYLPDFHDGLSLLFIETTALIGFLLQNLNRRDAGFLYTGITHGYILGITLGGFEPRS